MTAPTARVRRDTYRRDGDRCVVCNTTARLEWHHRQATGMGGRGTKAPTLTPADGICVCTFCNTAFEADLQTKALWAGWKVRKFCRIPLHLIPVYYPNETTWYHLNTDGTRDPLTETVALEYRLLAGTLNPPGGH